MTQEKILNFPELARFTALAKTRAFAIPILNLSKNSSIHV